MKLLYNGGQSVSHDIVLTDAASLMGESRMTARGTLARRLAVVETEWKGAVCL